MPFQLPSDLSNLLHPNPTGVVIYARARVQAVQFFAALGPSQLIDRGWELHDRLEWAWTHPGLPSGVGWYDRRGAFWMAQRLRRQKADASLLAVLGATTFGRAPDRELFAPTVLDLPVEGPDLPPVEAPVSRQRVIPYETMRPDIRNIVGVESEFGITCTHKSTSHAPSYFASLSLGGPLLRTDEFGRRRARREVLAGDARNVASFPMNIPWFIGQAACWLYRRVYTLGSGMQVSASSARTGNFKQLVIVYQVPESGRAGLYLKLPAVGGAEYYVAVPGQVRACTPGTFGRVAAELDRLTG